MSELAYTFFMVHLRSDKTLPIYNRITHLSLLEVRDGFHDIKRRIPTSAFFLKRSGVSVVCCAGVDALRDVCVCLGRASV